MVSTSRRSSAYRCLLLDYRRRKGARALRLANAHGRSRDILVEILLPGGVVAPLPRVFGARRTLYRDRRRTSTRAERYSSTHTESARDASFPTLPIRNHGRFSIQGWHASKAAAIATSPIRQVPPDYLQTDREAVVGPAGGDAGGGLAREVRRIERGVHASSATTSDRSRPAPPDRSRRGEPAPSA